MLTEQLYSWQNNLRQQAVGLLYCARKAPRVPAVGETEPRNILVIMTGLLGDTVMSVPLIIETRRLLPNARITVLGRRHNCELLSACPVLDHLVEAPGIPYTLRKRAELVQLKEWLRGQRFDLAIIALGDQFASVLAEAGIPLRAGASEHPLAPCLTHTYDIGSPRTWGPPERLNALRCLGFEVRDTPPKLWVSDTARGTAAQRLSDLGLSPALSYAVVHPFGSTPRQCWPVERVAELAEALWQQCGLRTVLIGGKDARDRVPGSVRKRAVDSTGALSIPELLAVVERASLVVSTDSGPFHIAGALRRPLVGMFRAQRPEHARRYPEAQVVFGRHSSCQKRCRWDRCQAEPCHQLNKLPVREVMELVHQTQLCPGTSRQEVSGK